jgi:hypothetical protein
VGAFEGSWLNNRYRCLPRHGGTRVKTDARVQPWRVSENIEELTND